MSSLSLLSVYLSALILLLPAVSEAQYYDLTPPPDYYDDYNGTFEYSFYSNASNEDLDKFSERFVDPEDEDQQEDTGAAGGTGSDRYHGNDLEDHRAGLGGWS